MKQCVKILVAVVICIIVSSCISSEEASVPGTRYRLFPSGYFSPGYREEYSLTGTSELGQSFQGTHVEQAQPYIIDRGREITPILMQTNWTDSVSTTMFAMSSLPRHDGPLNSSDSPTFEGVEDLISGVTGVPSGPIRLPKIGINAVSGGSIGTYIDSAGNNVELTYRFGLATNNFGQVSWSTIVSDGMGNIISIVTFSYVIDESGSRQSIVITIDIKASGDPITLAGTKQ